MGNRSTDHRNIAEFVTDTLQTGAIASSATTMVAAALGEAELGNPVSPLNAVSHILWGDRAAQVDELDTKHTVTGVALNSAAVTTWAALYELLAGGRARRGDVRHSLLAGAAVAGVAYVVDYHLVPRRLTPGFEKRLSGVALFGIYATLAASLGLGGLMTRR